MTNTTEREQIVAWLRHPDRRSLVTMDEVRRSYICRDPFPVGERIWEEVETPHRLPTPSDYADAIERGDHLKESN